MVLTHAEALQLASEARNRGDRAANRKYSNIARDLAKRRTSGEESISYFDTKKNRIVHSRAGSDIYVEQISEESDRYIPVNREQIKEIRRQLKEQREAEEFKQPEIRFQTVRDREGNILYTLEPGAEPGTVLITHPGQEIISPPPSSKWVVTYDLGRGERSQTFDTEQEARSFSKSLTTRAGAKISEQREQAFTLSGGTAFIDYLRSIGPPEPTEEQRVRIEAGLPLTGIPGPALTKPGSIKAKLQDFSEKVIEKTEIPFKAITDPLRETSRVLEKLSLDVFKTDVALQPPVQLGAQTVVDLSLADVLRVPTKQKPIVGTAAYLASIGIGVLATGIDVATFEIRPGLMIESVKGVTGLVLDPEVQKALAVSIARDPFRFVAEVVGGAFVGQQIKIAAPKIESDIRKFLAKREFERLGLDETLFTQFERELLFDFPEEVADSIATRRLFRRSELKVLDDIGLIEKKIPFFIETSPEVEKLLVDSLPDEFTPELVNKQLESYFALPFDDKGGAILVRGRAGMKPFAEAMDLLPPRAEQVAVSAVKPPSMSLKTVAKLFETTTVESAIFHFPAVDLRATLLTSAKAAIPSVFPSISISTLLAIKTIPLSDQRIKEVTKELFLAPAALKQITVQAPFEIQAPKPITFQIPKPVQVTVPFQVPIQVPFQIPVQIQQPIQKITQIQVQIPEIVIPTTVTGFKIPPPEPVKRIKIPGVKKKKKKKKKLREPGKGVFELRVDKIAKDILKVFKI